MRYIASICFIFLALGCGGDSTETPTDTSSTPDTAQAADTNTPPQDTTPATNCSPDCNGALANNPQGLCSIYNGKKYASGNVTCAADCTVDTSACVESIADLPAEFEACTNACEDGLQCVNWTPGQSFCLRPCTGENDTMNCGSNTCSGVADSDQDGVADVFFCLKKDAMRNQPCLDNLSLCAEGQGECQWTSLENGPQGPTPTNFRCKINCDEIGAQGTCPANEQCLTNSAGKVETQGTGQPIACTADADCEAGYDCMALTSGDYCARQTGWCGNASTPCGEPMSQEGIGACTSNPDNDCTATSSNLCSIVGATGEAADVLCIPLDASGSKSICIGFCGGEGDEETLDCGTGYQCVRPDDPGLLIPQEQKSAAGTSITCTDDTPCDAANSYKCVTKNDGSKVCGRAWKLCQKL